MSNHVWLFGGIAGLSVLGLPLALLQILSRLPIAPWKHVETINLVFATFLLEMPVVSIGRELNLPIENGGAPFFLYDLNFFGYIFVLLFGTVVGLKVGMLVQMLSER